MPAAFCPKQPWVLTVLSDDEALAAPGEVPPGLRFHLQRCDACKILADRLLNVSRALDDLAVSRPPDDLAQRAITQTTAVLREGARPTGRLNLADLPALSAARPAAYRRRRFAAYSAAASILLAVGLWSLANANRPDLFRPGLPNPQASLEERRPTTADPAAYAGTGTPSRRSTASSATPSAPTGRAPWPTGMAQEGFIGPPQPGRARRDRPTYDPSTVDALRRASVVRKEVICRHDSLIDAAKCDKPHAVHSAVVLPRRARRAVGLGQGRIDSNPRPSSTRRRSNRPSG
ncbi:MAG: hypothetical protein ACE5EX_06275 [Phycisphaerae bacterium]